MAARARLACLALAVAALSPPGLQAQPTGRVPVSHEALWTMKRVSGPSVSPDGKWVVFSLTEPSYDEKEQVSDLWLVPSDGATAPRRLTATRGGESGAAWSPDSTRLAFAARREGDEASQIYVIDLAGGEAQRVTTLSTGARNPQWRPDGQALLFESTVYPGAVDDEANKKIAAERKARKWKARVYEGFPIRQWDRWRDDMEPHMIVQELRKGAAPRDLLAGTKLVTEKGFRGTPGNSGDGLSAAWTPDGTGVVFVATTESDRSAYANVSYHLWLVPALGGEPTRLTSPPGSYASPAFSQDGKSLFARYEADSGKTYDLTRLVRLAWPGPGAPTVLTAGSDRSVGDFAAAPDGSVYFTAEDAGLVKLYQVPAAGGAVSEPIEVTEGVVGALSVPDAGGALYATWESAVRPAEVVRLDLATRARRPLTDLNGEAVAKIDWQPLRHFWFTSKGGRRIHNMIALPPGFDETKKYPLFVLIHGGAHNMWRDQISLRWNYHLLAQPGYVVLATNYTGSTGFGEKFAQDIIGDPFRTPGNEINEAADEAIKRFAFVDGTRQAAGGASYGGHLANWLQATTTRYKCLVSHAGLINSEVQWGTSDVIWSREVMNLGPPWEQGKVWREQNPIRYAKNFKTPVLVSVGENDFRVPLNNTLEYWSALKRMQVPSRLLVFPDANHWILKPEDSRFFYGEVHAWLKKYLLDGR